MGSKLYNSLHGSQNNSPNLMQQMAQLMQNPVQFLMERRLNIPPQIANDPKAIVQYWLNNGTMTQSQMTELQNRIQQTMPM